MKIFLMTHAMWRHPLVHALGFLSVAVLSWAAAGPFTGAALTLTGRTDSGFLAVGVYSAFVATMLLVTTWAALRQEGLGLSTLGLAFSRRRLVELVVGFAASAVLFSAVALARGETVGASWEFRGWAGFEAALVGLPLALALLLPEELLFRGYVFRKVIAALGVPIALSFSALVFGAYHLLGSGNWGMGAVFTFVLPALGGLVFGLAALRSGGLALPIGLHLGGNWVQASVVGLGSFPDAPVTAMWIAPLTAAQAQALYAPDLPRHVPYLLAIILAASLLARTSRAPHIGTA